MRDHNRVNLIVFLILFHYFMITCTNFQRTIGGSTFSFSLGLCEAHWIINLTQGLQFQFITRQIQTRIK